MAKPMLSITTCACAMLPPADIFCWAKSKKWFRFCSATSTKPFKTTFSAAQQAQKPFRTRFQCRQQPQLSYSGHVRQTRASSLHRAAGIPSASCVVSAPLRVGSVFAQIRSTHGLRTSHWAVGFDGSCESALALWWMYQGLTRVSKVTRVRP